MSVVWHAHIAITNEYVIKSLASHSDEFCASGPARGTCDSSESGEQPGKRGKMANFYVINTQ